MTPKIVEKVRHAYHAKMVKFWNMMHRHGIINRHTVEVKTAYHAFAALTDAQQAFVTCEFKKASDRKKRGEPI